MISPPTSLIPVTGLLEVENSVGDRLCVTAAGQQSWHVQVIRGSRNNRGSRLVILSFEAPDLSVLKAVVDEFLEGNYQRFEESSITGTKQKWIFLSFFGMALIALLGLTFLAYMISVFLSLKS